MKDVMSDGVTELKKLGFREFLALSVIYMMYKDLSTLEKTLDYSQTRLVQFLCLEFLSSLFNIL